MSITIRKVLDLFPDLELIAGEDGLDRTVTTVNIIDSPDIIHFLRGGELFLTNAYIFSGDLQALTILISKLASQNCAGIAITAKQFIDSVPEETVALANHLAFPIIIIPLEMYWRDIINIIMTQIINEQAAELSQANEIRESLTKIILNNGSISETLDELYRITDIYPMFIGSDLELRFRPSLPMPPHLQDDMDYILKNASKLIGYDVDLMASTPYLPDYIITPVEVKNVISGYIVGFIRGISVNSIDMTAYRYASVNISVVLLNSQAAQEQQELSKRDFLLELFMATKPQALDMLQAKSEEYGWDLSGEWIVAYVEISGYAEYCRRHFPNDQAGANKFKGILHDLIYRAFKARQIHKINLKKENSMVFLIAAPSFPEKRIWREVALEMNVTLQKYWEGLRATIGIGNACKITCVHESYQQAYNASRYGRALSDGRNVLYYRDFGIYQLLFEIDQTKLKWDFYQDAVGKLIQYDGETGSQLLTTLEEYLNCFNIKQTAQKLFIHPNTLRYRLLKIADITNCNPLNMHDRMVLEIGIVMSKIHASHRDTLPAIPL